MDGGMSYESVQAAVPESANVVSDPPRVLDMDLEREDEVAADRRLGVGRALEARPDAGLSVSFDSPGVGQGAHDGQAHASSARGGWSRLKRSQCLRAAVIADLDAQLPVVELDPHFNRALVGSVAVEHAVGHQLGDDQGCIAGPPPDVLPRKQIVQQRAGCRGSIGVTLKPVPGHTSGIPHIHRARHDE